MARTTIDLDPAVLLELRRLAELEGKTVGRVASELIAQAVGKRTDAPAPDFRWISADLGRPLVDLEDPEPRDPFA